MKKRKKLNVWAAIVMFLLLIVSTAAAGTIYVDGDAPGPTHDGSSWTYAYRYLQDALTDANSAAKPVEIRVAQGIHKPDHGMNQHLEDRYASFQLQNLVAIKGGYGGIGEPDPNARDIAAYETILSGEISDDEDTLHVVCGSGTDKTAVLDGFTITGGCAWSSNNYIGGGMYNYAGSPTVRNCTFFENYAGFYGGGMCNDGNSCPTLINCIFKNNSATDGGGMDNEYSNPILINCTFIGNSACPYNADTYGGAGMYNYKSNPSLINCLFTGNTAQGWGDAGGMQNNQSNPTLTNCTFSGNLADNNGGGMYNYADCNPTVTNCIFWGNIDSGGVDESAQIHNHSGAIPAINYCCVQGWTGQFGGIGNIGSDPLFVDADGIDNIIGTEDDNLRLLAGSSCIDAGDNSVVTVTTDLDGNPRIVNGTVDMGAYEFHGFFLSSGSITVPEGQTATFTVALAMDPLGTVEASVAVTSGDPDITIESGALLTFDSSNYAIPQSVTLAAAEDQDYLNGVAQISISATEFLYAGVTVTEMDNEIVPAILYVDNGVNDSGTNQGTSWSDAFTDLQKALGIAQEYSQIKEIRVAQSIYKPDQGVGITPGDRTATFQLINGVTLTGGYAGYSEPNPDLRDIDLYETILNGDLNGDDVEVVDPCDLLSEPNRAENSFHVVTGSGSDNTAVLDGFTVTAGNANGSSPYKEGGGMYNDNGSPTVTNCTFSGNTAVGDNLGSNGGGMFNKGGSPTLRDCEFIANSAEGSGGGIYNTYSTPTFVRCSFRGNSVKHTGGGVRNSRGSSPTLMNCTFIGNSAGCGGGMCNGSGSKPALTGCIFTDNSAESLGGAMVNEGGSGPTIVTCMFAGNSAGKSGGGMYNPGNTAVLINCTFIGNSAMVFGGGTYIYNHSTHTLTNCVFWANTSEYGSQVALYDGSTVSINYCDVEGGWLGVYNSTSTIDWGEGNIDVDPCFVEPGYWDPNGTPADANDDFWVDGDYHLLLGSPCIDTGDPNYIAEPNETDLDGKPRIIGGRIDMGAYEYSPPIPAEVKIVPRTINLASKGKWITCYIWLGEDYNVADINPNTVFLQREIQAQSLSLDEGQQVATAKFNRSDVQEILDAGEVELTITGRLTIGFAFEGTDVIRVIDKGRGK